MKGNVPPLGSDTIKRCGFVEVQVALLVEMCHCGVNFEVSCALFIPNVDSDSFYCLGIKM